MMFLLVLIVDLDFQYSVANVEIFWRIEYNMDVYRIHLVGMIQMNLFNNMTCIRFALMSPLRIVEFYGYFLDIQ